MTGPASNEIRYEEEGWGDEPRAIHALMSGLIDYAGLFPPAKLSMGEAVANYAKYAASAEAWMLGRFILPVSRIEEFRTASAKFLPKKWDDEDEGEGGGGWPISAIVDGDLDENLDSIFAFNAQHAEPRDGLAVIDAVEIKVPPISETDAPPPNPNVPFIESSLEIMAEGVYPLFELPVMGGGVPSSHTSVDLRGAIAALAGADAGAKIRTGGVVPGAIPTSRAVAEFLVACAQADVPFKATAGLHHAIRAEHPLTYEPGCPRAMMHGFLNVFIAAAMAKEYRLDVAAVVKVLDETDPLRFDIAEDAIVWGPGRVDIESIENMRDLFGLSFGSCSFEEPVNELRSLGVI